MRNWILHLVVFGALGFTSPAYATTFIERPFPEAVQDAPIVVRGRTGSPYSDWAKAKDGNRRIYTYTDLQIDEVLKGSPQSRTSVLMRELGGEKNGVGMQVSGTAQFERGEDVVVFLGPVNADGSHSVTGMMMGKLEVVKGDDGKQYLSGPVLGQGSEHSPAHVDSENEGQRDTLPVKKWTLESLRTLILEQSKVSNPSSSTVKTPEIQKVITPSPAATSSPMTSVQPAPVLQPLSDEASETPWGLYLSGVLGGLILVLLGVAVFRK